MKKILKLICFIPLFILLFGCEEADINGLEDTKTLVEAEVVVKLTGATYTTYPEQQEWLEGVGVHQRGSMITLTITIPEDSPFAFAGWYLTDEDFWKGRAASLETSYSFKADVDSYIGIKASLVKTTIILDLGYDGRGKVEGFEDREFRLDKPNHLTATPYLGSYFEGWYADNELISVSEDFDFIPTSNMKEIKAVFVDDQKMENYFFNSDEFSCVIIGVKDKTIVTADIPRFVTEIDMFAFSECYNLTFIELPRNLETIRYYAFNNCPNLESIIIPRNVLYIENDIFAGCSKLNKIFYGGKASEWEQIEIDDNNPQLNAATIYYFSNTKPTAAGNYWHYVNDVPTIWENE